MDINLFRGRYSGRHRIRGIRGLVMGEIMFKKKNHEEEKTDLGLRLLKTLLLRLYTMLSVNPLKWYEILISVIMGVLFGLGVGVMISSYVKASIIIKAR